MKNNKNFNLALIIGGAILVIVGIMNYSRNKGLGAASFILGAVATVWGIMNYSRNGRADTELIPCCTERDADCHCIEHEFKKSEDCDTVPCPTKVSTQPQERPVDYVVVGTNNPLAKYAGIGGGGTGAMAGH